MTTNTPPDATFSLPRTSRTPQQPATPRSFPKPSEAPPAVGPASGPQLALHDGLRHGLHHGLDGGLPSGLHGGHEGHAQRRSAIASAREAEGTTDMQQTEFEFPPALAVSRRVQPARAATGVLGGRYRRRPAAPQSARLEICPEAFVEPARAARARGPARTSTAVAPGAGLAADAGLAAGARFAAGAFDAIAALLATIVFGLGWAALELQREPPRDLGGIGGIESLGPERRQQVGPGIGWEVGSGDLGESRYDRAIAGAWELAAASPDPAGSAARAPGGGATRGNEPWIEGAPSERVAGRSNR